MWHLLKVLGFFFMMCSIYVFLGDSVDTLWALLKVLQPCNYTYSALHKHSPCINEHIPFNISIKSRKTHRPVTSGLFRLNVLKMKFCPGIRHVLSFLNSMFPGFLKKLQTGRLVIISHSLQQQHFLKYIRIPMLQRCATSKSPKHYSEQGPSSTEDHSDVLQLQLWRHTVQK